ncbi:hypothetical protein [Faecalibacterium prausnitzii]|uniref:hypothetical protein n=1 Tax=Faecalibacterium prausnitzii TaxID=853 RepID=UPI0015ECD6FC|nr:hypothetical protein [Faecalibacterium prausnitzii]
MTTALGGCVISGAEIVENAPIRRWKNVSKFYAKIRAINDDKRKREIRIEKLAHINFAVSDCYLCKKSWEIRGRKLFVSTNR